MPELKVGFKAPAFTGFDQNGKEIKLSDFAGKKVVLFFYPQDDTPTCTNEVCNLRDNYNTFIKNGYVLIGVSPDNEKSHKHFALKFSLPFQLVADTSMKIINDYSVWGEKELFGRKYMGVIRTTFVIDKNGVIEKIISKVDSSNHTEQVFNADNK